MDDRRQTITTDLGRRATNRNGWARLAMVALLTLLLLLLPNTARAQGSGVIAGTVSVVEGETLPEDLQVDLLFLPNGQGPPVITSQPLAEDNTYRFTDVDTSPEHRYLVRVTVGEEDNLSDLLLFEAGQTTLDVPIRLFERTTDASALSLPQVAYVLDSRADGWLVLALFRFENGGDRIIENLTNPPANVPIPAGATDVQFEQAVDFDGIVELSTGFAYTGPFPPGETAFVFSYVVPYVEGEQTLTLPVGTDADQVSVLVPQLGQQTTADILASAGVENGPNDEPYELFQAANVPGASSINLQLTGLPAAPAPAPGEETTTTAPQSSRILPISPLERLPRWAPLVPMALVALGVFAYVFSRPAPTGAEQRGSLRTRRDTLVAEIAALDIRYEAGAIGEQTHKRQRETLKNELKAVLRQLGQSVATS